jgi:hypothetical protein
MHVCAAFWLRWLRLSGPDVTPTSERKLPKHSYANKYANDDKENESVTGRQAKKHIDPIRQETTLSELPCTRTCSQEK